MTFTLAVTGSIGAGKTMLASRLAAERGALLLSSDAVRLELTPNQRRRGERVFHELHRRFEAALEEGRAVVLDSTGMSPRFRALLRAHRKELVHVHLLLRDPHCFAARERQRSDREAGPLPYAAFRRSQGVAFHDAPDLVVATDHLDADALHRFVGRYLDERRIGVY
jgi:predicted kinase